MIRIFFGFYSQKLAAFFTLGFLHYSHLINRSIDLVDRSQRAKEKDYLNFNYEKTLSLLSSESIIFLHVGAGAPTNEGPYAEAIINKYFKFFRPILIEPRPIEAARLKDAGFLVVDKAISNKIGGQQLYITGEEGQSSLLRPTGEFASIYSSVESMEVVKTIEIETTTIDKALSQLNVKKLDYLKVDTQGTELDVLRSLGRYQPIFVKTEIFMVPSYENSCLFWDIGGLLLKNGYIMFDLAYRSNFINRGSPPYKIPVGRVPTGGTALFMPNWKCEAGRQIIHGRDLEYAKLMIMFGMADILKVVISDFSTPNDVKILSALVN